MRIIGKDEQQVELKILGYQFPTDFDNEWDANWLRISLIVKSNLGHWQTVDPSLTTWEVKQLIEWFTDLSQDKDVEYTEMTFVEPNLVFELIDKKVELKTIQIRFDYESKPQSADNDKEYFIDFHFSNQDLATIANDLRAEYEKFPVRIYSAASTVISSVDNDKKPWWKFW